MVFTFLFRWWQLFQNLNKKGEHKKYNSKAIQ